jgi:multidrug transporter EmrE-like cation transporter
MTSLAYIATVTAGVVLFHERLNVTRVAGVLVIIAGVVLLASDENSPRVTEEGIDG